MDIYMELLAIALDQEQMNFYYPNYKYGKEKILEKKANEALKKVRTALENSNLTDQECFSQIQKIISNFEKL